MKKYIIISVLISLCAMLPCFSAPVDTTNKNFVNHVNTAGFSVGEIITSPTQAFVLKPAVYNFFMAGFSNSDNINPTMPPANVGAYVLVPKKNNDGSISKTEYTSVGAAQPLFIWYIIKSNSSVYKIEITGSDLKPADAQDKAYFETTTGFIAKDGTKSDKVISKQTDGKYNTVVILDEAKTNAKGLRQGSYKLVLDASLKGTSASKLKGVPFTGEFVITITTQAKGNTV